MNFRLIFTPTSREDLRRLEATPDQAARLKAVRKCLDFLEANPRHPGLQTHKFHERKGPQGQDIFEAYAQNRTPGAYRVFWCYGAEPRTILILLISPHP